MGDHTRITDSTQEIKKEVHNSLVIKKDVKSTPQTEIPNNAQVMNELANLSINTDGRTKIQEIIDQKKNTAFHNKWVTILNRKKIDVPIDLPDRHTFIATVQKQHGDKITRAFVLAKGGMAKETSEQVMYKPEIANKFQEYQTEAKLQKEQETEIIDIISKKGLSRCKASIDLEQGGIDIFDSIRDQEADSMPLSTHIGQLCEYTIHKSAIGKDDFGTKIGYSAKERFKITRLGRCEVSNSQTIETVILLFKSQLRKAYEAGDLGLGQGSIWMKKDSEAFISMLGTPNGQAPLFLPKEYPQFFVTGQISGIDVQFSMVDERILKDKIDHSSVQIDQIDFYYDE